MKTDDLEKAYAEYLLSKGQNVVAYDNGDMIVTASPRFPQVRKAPGKKSCDIESCIPGSSNTRTISIDHGDRYYGHERQDDGTCVKKNYDCDDGALVAF